MKPGELVTIEGLALLVFVGIVYFARRRLLSNRAGRQLTAFFFVWGWHPMALGCVQLAKGDATFDFASASVGGMMISAIGTIALLPELWPTLPIYLGVMALCVARPEKAELAGFAQIVLNAAVIVRALRARAIRTELEEAAHPERTAV